jgi:monovalent cation:proton antiporter-2 (CPA2) family protein
MLVQTAILLLGAVIFVPLAKHAGLGAVLGYLFAGVLLGPWGLGLIDDVSLILHFGEFGVILLLFVIGLELRPSRLWVLRRTVLGLGSLQVAGTALVLAAIGLALGLETRAALIIGLAGAMSSTAMVLQSLAERNQLADRHGRAAFAILLFQDMAVIPILAVVPVLAAGSLELAPMRLLGGIAAIVGVIAAGRFLLRPLFTRIATLGSRETFTAASLLVVIGTTVLMDAVGLAPSLGAFLAGVVLADSEFRHELEADLEPFKGLLLGVFFMAVGMSTNMGLLVTVPGQAFGLAALLLLIKTAVVLAIGIATGESRSSARKLAIALSQGGEFAFVIFQLAFANQLLERPLMDLLTVAVTLSLLLWPLLFLFEERVLSRCRPAPERPFDTIDTGTPAVIIAGFGRVGQVVARLLALKGIPFTVLEADPQQVDYVRRFGSKVYFGDASRLDLLNAASTGEAKLFVLAIDNVEASLKIAELMRRHFPAVKIIARARNRFHAYKLMDLGIESPIRETLHGSIVLSEMALTELGVAGDEAARIARMFAEHDAEQLLRQQAVYQDEAQLVASVLQAREELRTLFEQDEELRTAAPPG